LVGDPDRSVTDMQAVTATIGAGRFERSLRRLDETRTQ
jgi:hypothetical protein